MNEHPLSQSQNILNYTHPHTKHNANRTVNKMWLLVKEDLPDEKHKLNCILLFKNLANLFYLPLIKMFFSNTGRTPCYFSLDKAILLH